MAFPHPFRTSRSAGTPSTGGTSFTIGTHIGSSSAHPVYQKKGDAISGFSIAEHENNVNAHRTHYLRRLELAVSLAAYNSSKGISAENYQASSGNLGTAYPIVITSRALDEILRQGVTGITNSIPELFPWKNIIGTYNDEDGSVKSISGSDDASPTKLYAQVNNATEAYVPSWKLFTELYGFTHGLLENDAGTNKLFDIFAKKEHTHTGYALTKHKHMDWDDLQDASGNRPATANHTHSEYLRWDTDLNEASLRPLIDVGIYTNTVLIRPLAGYVSSASAGLEESAGTLVETAQVAGNNGNKSINTNTAQGNTTYLFGRNELAAMIDGGLPSQLGAASVGINATFTGTGDSPALIASEANLKYTAVLSVLRGTSDPVVFGSSNLAGMIASAPSDSTIYHAITQILTTDVGIAGFDRSGTTLKDAVKQYKHGVYRTYYRTGCSYESAWYITGVLSAINATPGNFIGTFEEADRIDEIASSVTSKLSSYLNDPSTRPRNGLNVGVYKPLSTDIVRASTSLWQGMSQSDYEVRIRNRKIDAGALVATSPVVAHDISRWLVPGGFNEIGNPINASVLVGYDAMANLTLTSKHNQLLPYQRYFIKTETYPEYTGMGEGVIPTHNPEFYKLVVVDGKNTYPAITLETAGYTSSDILDDDAEDRYIAIDSAGDEGYYQLHEYCNAISIGAATTYQADVKYYSKNIDPDVNGLAAFTLLVVGTDYTIGDDFLDNTYVRVRLQAFDSEMWSKIPVTAGSAVLDGAVQYYVYDAATHQFQQFKTAAEFKESGTYTIPATHVNALTLFIDHQLFTRVVSSTQLDPTANTKLLPITIAGSKFIGNHTYKYEYTPAGATEPIVIPVEFVDADDDNANVLDEGVCMYRVQGSTIPTTGTGRYLVEVPSYIIPGTESSSEPRYYNITPDAEHADEQVYCAAFFYVASETTPVPGKKYYTANADIDTYDLFSGSTFIAGTTYYEIIDLEKFFDIHCAIKLLTTYGSENVRGVAEPQKIIYNIDNNGDLITWNDWQRLLNENDDAYIYAHTHGNKSLLDQFTYSSGAGLKYGDLTIQTEGSTGTAHVHPNKPVLDAIGERIEIDEIPRLTYTCSGVTYNLAYLDDIGDILNTFEAIAPGLEVTKRLSFDSNGNVLIDSYNSLAYTSDIHTFANQSVLDNVTQGVIESSHLHTNKQVLDEFGTDGGKLTYSGNAIGAFAATYTVNIADAVSVSALLAIGTWHKTLTELNTLIGNNAFADIAELEQCQFQFKLVARLAEAGLNYTEVSVKDPIAVFEGDDDSHLSASFTSDSISVLLPGVDYFVPFSGQKSSLTDWATAESVPPTFKLVMYITRPGTLGTGAGQVLAHYETLNSIYFHDANDDHHLCYGDVNGFEKFVWASDLNTLVGGLGYVTTASLGTLAWLNTPSNWEMLTTQLRENPVDHCLYFNDNKLAFFSDLTPFDNDELLRSLSVDVDNTRLAYKATPNGTPIELAKQADLTSAQTTTQTAISAINTTITTKFSSITNLLASASDKTNLDTARELTHSFEYTEVDITKVIEPVAGETYYTRTSEVYTAVPNLVSFVAGTTYYTRTAKLLVSGSKISGVGTGSGTGLVEDIEITSSITNNPITISGVGTAYVLRLDLTDEQRSGNYTVYLKATNDDSIIYNPIVNVAPSTNDTPIYVPAASLIMCDKVSNAYRLLMRIPLEWCNFNLPTSSFDVYVRFTPVTIA